MSTKKNHLAVTAIVLLASLAGVACNQGGEGDRCNPLLSHDECGGGLVCSGPSTSHPLPGVCVENYCCPADPTKSSDGNCNGTAPACVPDAGAGDDSSASDAAGE